MADAVALAELDRVCRSGSWSVRAFEQELESDHSSILVLRRVFEPDDAGRGIVAYCALSVVADEMQMLNLAVAPARRRGGLGGWLLRLACSVGAHRGARTAFLEARRSNRTAIRLYESLGFIQVAARRDYYNEPREDALVLAKAGLVAGLLGRAC